MQQEQIPIINTPTTRLAFARQEPDEDRPIVPRVYRKLPGRAALKTIVPFTNSIPTPDEYNAIMQSTRDYNAPMEIEVTQPLSER
jgi:hypothetical protein